MTMNLTGDVGRDGRAEDVAIVQALLANIKGPDGKPFLDRRIDGRPGTELAAAIEAFQRRWVGAGGAVGASELGMVRPGSRTWQSLYALFSPNWGELSVTAINPMLLCATKGLRTVASGTADRLRKGSTVRERMVGHRLRLELATVVERVGEVIGVGLAHDRTALVGDRVATWFVPVGLSVLDEYGRPQSAEGRSGDVPAALWAAVDREVPGRAAVEAIGRGSYRPREGLQSRGAIRTLRSLRVSRSARRLSAAISGLCWRRLR